MKRETINVLRAHTGLNMGVELVKAKKNQWKHSTVNNKHMN